MVGIGRKPLRQVFLPQGPFLNLYFRQAVIRATLKKQREKSQEILLAGQHLILSGLQAGVRMKELYFSGSSVLDDFPVEAISGIPVYKITYRQMKQWSDINTPEGLIGGYYKHRFR